MENLNIQWQGPVHAPAVVLLHGFTGLPADWSPVCETLSQWQVGLVELQPMDPVTFLNSLAAALEAKGLRSAGICGYSMGGRLAMYCAMQNPALFPILIGVSTTPGIEDAEERATRAAADKAMSDRLRSLRTAAEFEAFLREWWQQDIFLSPRMHSALLDQMVESRLTLDPAVLAGFHALWSSGTLPSQWEHLPDYPGGVLLIAGAEDGKYVEITRRMETSFRDATVEVIAKCGHQLLWEAPQELGWSIHHFLETRASALR